MLRYLSLDIICSSKLTVFLELRSRKTVRFSEKITSADKYLSIFSRQMEAIVYLLLDCFDDDDGDDDDDDDDDDDAIVFLRIDNELQKFDPKH